ncbi:hypothetical protein [Brevibacillus dissolubilis]|uniref:hypothetical protein n=1 Tax=Brevibacillus dissolubilis TaxID=1844116 RepID=UPI00111748EB|nr:hypothetical protein [Brevibacillus dissolubilis]
MSLKAVELQIAIPRTQEIGRIQEQQQQRHNVDQQALIRDRKELDEKARIRPQDINQKANGQIKEKQEREHTKKEKENQTAPVKQESRSASSKKTEGFDPMRGRHIDISL